MRPAAVADARPGTGLGYPVTPRGLLIRSRTNHPEPPAGTPRPTWNSLRGGGASDARGRIPNKAGWRDGGESESGAFRSRFIVDLARQSIA